MITIRSSTSVKPFDFFLSIFFIKLSPSLIQIQIFYISSTNNLRLPHPTEPGAPGSPLILTERSVLLIPPLIFKFINLKKTEKEVKQNQK